MSLVAQEGVITWETSLGSSVRLVSKDIIYKEMFQRYRASRLYSCLDTVVSFPYYMLKWIKS
jgi:hypothetical protein